MLQIGTHDEVHVVGTTGADTFTADGFAANLNAGEATSDDDLSVSGDGELELLGDEGDDEIVLAGYGGANAEIPKIARGGPGTIGCWVLQLLPARRGFRPGCRRLLPGGLPNDRELGRRRLVVLVGPSASIRSERCRRVSCPTTTTTSRSIRSSAG